MSLTLEDKDEVSVLIEFCKNLPCVGYVFGMEKTVDDSVEFINECKLGFTFEKYIDNPLRMHHQQNIYKVLKTSN